MAVENVIELENIKAHLMFTIHMDYGTEEVSLEVGCAEDIENMMQLYFKESWEELFEDDYDRMNFNWASFNGISFVNNDNNRIGMQIYGNYAQGSCSLDMEFLTEKNADKLKRIREIASE